jgi:hypothetical protein
VQPPGISWVGGVKAIVLFGAEDQDRPFEGVLVRGKGALAQLHDSRLVVVVLGLVPRGGGDAYFDPSSYQVAHFTY